ncbi:MAG: hypothetical protein HKN47_09780 [Pirellulaceae bacterium]|nr:hypothetical protein [Pirellulaceae bacterium]
MLQLKFPDYCASRTRASAVNDNASIAFGSDWRSKRLMALLALLLTTVTTGCTGSTNPKQDPASFAGSNSNSNDINSNDTTAMPGADTTAVADDNAATTGAVARPGTLTSQFVGSDACIDCHRDRHASFQKSHHSRSLTKVDVESEVPVQDFQHVKSKRSYDVLARDGKLWHRETLLESKSPGENNDEPFVLNEFPVDYVIGSGKFAKGYLVSHRGFLVQSPLTWYAGNQQYDMSPGYDNQNASFSRTITDQCLFCHAGHLTRSDDNPNFFTIHESSIGCERCHGPGSQHVQHYQDVADGSIKSGDASFDDPIVHPKKLSRLLSESVCAQCHRQGEAPVSVPGKQDWDFRPGQDLASVKFDYDAITTDKPGNGFVGHFAQLHESQCYLQSEMTCVTCHSPHHHPQGEQKHELHRRQCVQCHEDQGCGLSIDDRVARAENRCVTCHMPKRDSDVPHTSTTNHRIAVHGTDEPGKLLEVPIARGLQEIPANMPTDQVSRMDALGSYWLFRKHLGEPHMELFANQAGNQLQQIAKSGKGDADVFAALAKLTHMGIERTPADSIDDPAVADQWQWAMTYAQEAIRLEQKPTESVAEALEIAGRYFAKSGQHQLAAEVFFELTAIRRRKYDWATLGLSLGKLGDATRAESAVREAIKIEGGDPDLYEILAILIRKRDPAEAQRLEALAQRLRNAAGDRQ